VLCCGQVWLRDEVLVVVDVVLFIGNGGEISRFCKHQAGEATQIFPISILSQ
jgi:hypothetical protein